MKLKMESKEYFNDLEWAEKEYPELQKKYADTWVAIVDQKVVASGKSLKNVELEAEQKTKRKRSEIPVLFVESGGRVYQN